MIIVTVYFATPYIVIHSVTVHNLKFGLIPLPKREFLSTTRRSRQWRDSRHKMGRRAWRLGMPGVQCRQKRFWKRRIDR